MITIIISVVALALGFVMLVKGSDFFVDGASSLATKLGIPQLIIGLTIVAMGTSAPEAAVSITAAFKGNADITIGNIVGSNILNILIILGITSMIVPVAVAKSTVRYEIPYMIMCSVVLYIMGMDTKISFFEGIVLWVLFVLYLIYMFLGSKNNKETESQQKYVSGWIQLLYIVGGMAAIIAGSRLAVYGATEIARIIGMSERFIGLTIVALGTSLPELFTSVTAAKKGNADIAIGNIVGSNIFNILFIVGTTALMTVVPFDKKFMVDSIVVIASAMVLFLGVVRRKKITRACGLFMLLCYCGYFVFLLAN